MIYFSDGNITRYAYDDKDRLTDIFYPDTGDLSVHFTYNGNDQIVTFTDLNGTIVQNTYDNAGRLTDQNIIAGPGVEGSGYRHFEYDGLNRLILASNIDSEVIFVYDQAGRIQREIQKIKENTEGIETVVATYEVMYQHDDNNNKVQVTYPSGKIVIITPDALDRIVNIKDASGDPNTFLASYTYEGKGKILEKILQNGITMNAIFDDGRRPEIISYKYKDTDYTLIERGMYWNLSDLKKFDYEAGKTETFKYDSSSRLRNVNNKKNNSSYEYKIDGVENVDQISETKDGTVKIIGTLYNSRHQLVKYNGMDLSYDNNGNLTQYKHNYSYNWNNQLAKVTTGTGVNIEYKYDALGRRIVKKVKDPDSETETRYVYDDYQVIEERDKNNHVQYRYTYGNGIDERIRMEQRVVNDDGSEDWKSYYLLHDSICNVIGLTNHRRHLIERYEYTPYGEVTYYNSENAPEVDNIKIENGKIKIRFNRPVDPDNIYINLLIKATQTSIPGSKEIFDFDRDIEFSPEQIPQNETLTIKLDCVDELSGSTSQPIELISKDFVYQGEPSMLVHDQGPPRVERIQYEKSSNSLNFKFNEDIDTSSITDSVEIEYGGNSIGGSIEISGDKQINFVPSENLSSNIDYIIKVKDIKDAAAKTIEVFTYNFQLNQEESLIFNLSILAKNNHSVVGNNSLMHGRTYEPEIGLYYYRNRYYHPELGRFLQQDPMEYEDSMNLYQGFGMNPVNFVDPYGLQEKEFYSMYIANPDDLDRIQNLQSQARKGYAKGGAAAAATFILSPLSVPTIIALCGSSLIYHGLENYSDRRVAGQSKLESRTGAVVDALTLGTYPIFSGRDAGTGVTVSGEQKLKIVSDLIPYTIGGAAGIVSGSIFSRLNPSTYQLIDDAFRVLDFKRKSTGYVAITSEGGAGVSHNAAKFMEYQEGLARLEFKQKAKWKPSTHHGDELIHHAYNRHPSMATTESGVIDPILYDTSSRANILNMESEIHSLGGGRYAAFNPGTGEFTVFSWQGGGGLAPNTPTIHSYYIPLRNQIQTGITFQSKGIVNLKDIRPK